MPNPNPPNSNDGRPPDHDRDRDGIWPPPPMHSPVASSKIEGVMLHYIGDTLTIDCTARRKALILKLCFAAIAYAGITWFEVSYLLRLQHKYGLTNWDIFGSLLTPLLPLSAPIIMNYMQWSSGRGSFVYRFDKGSNYCLAGTRRKILLSNTSFISVRRQSIGSNNYTVSLFLNDPWKRSGLVRFLRWQASIDEPFWIGYFSSKEIAEKVAREIDEFAGVGVRVR